MKLFSRVIRFYLLPVFRLLAGTLLMQFPTELYAAGDYHDTNTQCHLLDFSALLQQPELQTNTGLSPEQAYRRVLSRFVSLHYNKVARDILQGKGEYLDTLNHLMGTNTGDSQSCPQLFKAMLLSSPGPGGFTQALLIQRIPSAESAQQTDIQTSGATTYPDHF